MTENKSIFFRVVGRPAPQGSKRYVGRGRSIEASKYLPAWREAVRNAAREAYSGEPISEPVRVRIMFHLEKPKSTKYVLAPAGKPDIDKLIRGCFDSMSGIIYADDKLVVSVEADKVWADGDSGASIWIVTIQ